MLDREKSFPSIDGVTLLISTTLSGTLGFMGGWVVMLEPLRQDNYTGANLTAVPVAIGAGIGVAIPVSITALILAGIYIKNSLCSKNENLIVNSQLPDDEPGMCEKLGNCWARVFSRTNELHYQSLEEVITNDDAKDFQMEL